MINLLMAALFVSLRWERPHRRGLTMSGAIAMTVGTGLTAIGAIMVEDGTQTDLVAFLHVIYLFIFVFNMIYVYLLTISQGADAAGATA